MGRTIARTIVAIVIVASCTVTVGIFGVLVTGTISGVIGRVDVIPGTKAGIYGLVSGAIAGIVVGLLLVTHGKVWGARRIGATLASGYLLVVAGATVAALSQAWTDEAWAGFYVLLLVSPWSWIYVFLLVTVLPDPFNSIYAGIGLVAGSGLINAALLYSLGLLPSRLGAGR